MLEQLKPIMQNGERYIVVEGGKPEYVVLRFQDYVGLASMRSNPMGESRMPEIRSAEWEAANAELEEGRATDPTTIRLEDLPL